MRSAKLQAIKSPMGIRPNGPVVYLAQAEGLGMDIEWIVRAEGPAVCIGPMGALGQTAEPLALCILNVFWTQAFSLG